MAIIITSLGSGEVYQRYRYLYEPFNIRVRDDGTFAKKIYMSVTVGGIGYQATDPFKTYVKYGEFDISANNRSIELDLAKIAREFADHDVYKVSNLDHIASNQFSASTFWRTVVCNKYISFSFFTDESATSTSISPQYFLMGNRPYFDVTFGEDENYKPYITEFEKYGITQNELWDKFSGYPTITTNLVSIPTDPDTDLPSVSVAYRVGDEVNKCIKSFIIWKSRYGGWMAWGFEISSRKEVASYMENIESEPMESFFDNNFYQNIVPVNYTGIESSYTMTMKSLSLSSNELKAVSGIRHSPAIYLLKDLDSGELELMRLSSVTAPIESQTSGGDFSVTLKSIHTEKQLTR